jgi:uncharacterized protein (UPF0332 family)
VGGQPENVDRPQRGSRGSCTPTPEVGAFNRDFVHVGAFPREFTAILARLFEDRQTGDYDPTASLDAAEAERDVQDAQQIVEAVAEHLSR